MVGHSLPRPGHSINSNPAVKVVRQDGQVRHKFILGKIGLEHVCLAKSREATVRFDKISTVRLKKDTANIWFLYVFILVPTTPYLLGAAP